MKLARLLPFALLIVMPAWLNAADNTPPEGFTALFNGKIDAPSGGSREDAPEKYEEYRKVVNKLLEQPDSIKLKVRGIRIGDQIDVNAEVSASEKPGAKVKLRLALVEAHNHAQVLLGQLQHRLGLELPSRSAA